MNSGVFIEGLNDKERRAPTHICMSVRRWFRVLTLLHYRDVVAMDELQRRHAPSWG